MNEQEGNPETPQRLRDTAFRAFYEGRGIEAFKKLKPSST